MISNITNSFIRDFRGDFLAHVILHLVEVRTAVPPLRDYSGDLALFVQYDMRPTFSQGGILFHTETRGRKEVMTQQSKELKN